MFAGKVHDLRYLGLCDLIGIDTAFAYPVVVDMQHNSCGGFVILAEEAFQHVHDELHRRVVVVENKNPVHIRPLGLRLCLGNDRCPGSALLVPALAIVVGHSRRVAARQARGRRLNRCKWGHHGRGIAFQGLYRGRAVT